MNLLKLSLAELNARERVQSLLDEGTYHELLDPFQRVKSPHLEPQGIIPQNDDGVVIAQGKIDGKRTLVISIEGAFQGGGIGEVSGSKIAGALELAIKDNREGRTIYPVILFDTGGVRLQEANYGLMSIAEIGSAIVELRDWVPVIGVIPGKVGCFGGMSIIAGLCSRLIMTREGRLGLNGPEVIEQEAGLEEFDSTDRPLIWGTIGGAQRVATGFADILADDDVEIIKDGIVSFMQPAEDEPRSAQVDQYFSLIKSVDPTAEWSPASAREFINQQGSPEFEPAPLSSEAEPSRGRTWFQALTGNQPSLSEDVPSFLCADAKLGEENARFLSIVPDAHHRFPRVRHGEVGLLEGWSIAHYVREAMEADEGEGGTPRPIVAIIDVPSQAYGHKEELFGLHQACAAAVNAYTTARLHGHPVIALIVGNAISGAFLSHGFQANRILAFDDAGVNVHAMSKQSAARVTRRTIEELEEATKKVPAMAYDIHSFNSLGALASLISGIDADSPAEEEVETVREKIVETIKEIREGGPNLKNRLTSENAVNGGRRASIDVRKKLAEQWK
ncbi:biotin-independent malonate decarboxylase subunit beta [Fictibacillus fluitans]|uniref:Biotin-independent malonate decarboxylase subunit beta n=1 Tax=Fictibacillus fluitans TaxID=3058422 RepID=A0ABT8HYT8_9BACL|nr:biotin-independent malonate decarboxylase subunit beta [Fictibacillus sp. NE201]MDN4525943.1 biotin-independent malonate decarboxylase subunit beta [Fictibacillus sp. NE201]